MNIYKMTRDGLAKEEEPIRKDAGERWWFETRRVSRFDGMLMTDYILD